ncbi:MAG: heme-binding protein [Hyphomicrobiales bacterium]|nr:heme-binding protein [Hyphomicrobiales bacterium]
MRTHPYLALATALFASLIPPLIARAADCPADRDKLEKALKSSVKPSGGPSNGGFDNNEWAALVTRDGAVCAVAFSGAGPDDQWPASRAIAAEKANTANGVSLKGFAISTANLYAGAQHGGYLYGLDTTNPPDPAVLYAGDPMKYGSPSDPLVGKRLGGVVTFGGGLALYDGNNVVGALGVSGDSSCADHNVAWRVRAALGLDKVPAGPGPDHNDEIIYDVTPGMPSPSGFGHPQCKRSEAEVAQQIHSGFVPRWAQAAK